VLWCPYYDHTLSHALCCLTDLCVSSKHVLVTWNTKLIKVSNLVVQSILQTVFRLSPTKKSIKMNFHTECFKLIQQPLHYQQVMNITFLILQGPSKIHSILTNVTQMNNSHSKLRYTMYFGCKHRKCPKLICAITVQPYLSTVNFSTLLYWLQWEQHNGREVIVVAKSGVYHTFKSKKTFHITHIHKSMMTIPKFYISSCSCTSLSNRMVNTDFMWLPVVLHPTKT
jgi:hypothetical protein